jgi:hypothetical protein
VLALEHGGTARQLGLSLRHALADVPTRQAV